MSDLNNIQIADLLTDWIKEKNLDTAGTYAQEDNMLSKKQEKIVTISSLTAKGDLDRLKPELIAGLEAGLTVNEIKEVLVHLYAYSGFP